MKRHSVALFAGCLVAMALVGLACSQAKSPQGGTGGGTTSASGGSASGGVTGSGGGATGGATSNTGGTTQTVTGSGGTTVVGTGGTVGSGGQAGRGSGGAVPSGGTPGTGGRTATGGQAGRGTGGAVPSGGVTSTGGSSATAGQTGGSVKTGGAPGTGGQPDGGATSGCVPTKSWGTVDPSVAGPFEVVVEKNVGPAAGVADAKWNNEIPHFNVYRPKDMSQGYCHPVITWGNGTGDQPEPNPPLCLSENYCGSYKVLINQLASHGFVVVASLSSQTAQGTPLPQVVGVDWMIQENENPASALYHHLDTTHIGATGHSQGGAATTMAGADPRIVAIAPLCGSRANITLHGPAILICGGADTTVPCSSVQTAFDSITTVPVMQAELAGMTHGSWIGSIKDPAMVGVTGWMRAHLMNDATARAMFYGPSCKVCSDSKWKIQRKMMDQ
jgi:hypothetical protein